MSIEKKTHGLKLWKLKKEIFSADGRKISDVLLNKFIGNFSNDANYLHLSWVGRKTGRRKEMHWIFYWLIHWITCIRNIFIPSVPLRRVTRVKHIRNMTTFAWKHSLLSFHGEFIYAELKINRFSRSVVMWTNICH